MPGKRTTKKSRRKTTSKKTRSPEQPKEPQPAALADTPTTSCDALAAVASLPPNLRTQIDEAIRKRPKELESIKKIYAHFALKNHGITQRSFSAYVRHANWRHRLAATGQVVEAMFGSSDRDEADRLCDRAYLSLMSTVADMLQERVQVFPTDELARMSKIITDNRAVRVKESDVELKTAKQTDAASGRDKANPPTTGLPENFDEIVRRIYGVEIKVK